MVCRAVWHAAAGTEGRQVCELCESLPPQPWVTFRRGIRYDTIRYDTVGTCCVWSEGCWPCCMMRSCSGDSNWPSSSAEVSSALIQVFEYALQSPKRGSQEVMAEGMVQLVEGRKAHSQRFVWPRGQSSAEIHALLCGAPSGEWKKAVHTENGWRRWTPVQRQTDRQQTKGTS